MSPVTASDRIQRLLSVVSWIASRGDPPVREVCERFGLSPSELQAELDLAQMVGADSPEFSDMPIEVDYEGDRVSVFLHNLSRPLRLTPQQALAIVAAGYGLRAVPGHDPSGPLARALDKLAVVLDIPAQDAVAIDLGAADEHALARLRSAQAAHAPVRLDYYSAARDRLGSRVVEPWRVFSDEGAWYVEGWCREARGERVFRVDRIRAVEVLDETFEPPERPPEPRRAMQVAGDDPRAVVAISPEARWVAESYPVDSVDEAGDGTIRVRLPVAGAAWLERLLLRLGPAGRLVEVDPRIGPPDLAERAARRILARYGQNPASGTAQGRR
ncbi:MAG: WYL domain-containing protein [Actinobacteria bacterium]|nr:WYL domain-containing protein [Actinomycetota bacterium]